MSQSPENHPEHGTITSYVVGFGLSLIFTLIPYYLVVNQTLGRRALLTTILGFAVLQLVVQLVFFLHLGRERGPRWNLFFFIATAGIVMVVVIGSIWIMHHLHYNMTSLQVADKISQAEAVYQIGDQPTGTCPGNTGTDYQVVISDQSVTPGTVEARRCDRLIIINNGAEARNILFGNRGQAGTYAGESEITIRPGRNELLTLTETGSYRFYDPSQPDISASFTVEP